MLQDVLHTNYSDTIVVGDFNFGFIKWETKSTIMGYVKSRVISFNTIGIFFRATELEMNRLVAYWILF